MKRQIVKLTADHTSDFLQLHSDQNEAGWCFCVAWWAVTWDGWSERTAAANRQLRMDLWKRGEYDGYLLVVDDAVAGWCQVGQRDRLAKLSQQFALAPDADTWAITCFLIAPPYRGQGHTAYMLDSILADLAEQGVKHVEAFPRRGDDLDVYDLWNGPEAMFIRRGFLVVQDDPARPVLRLSLDPET